MGGSGATVRRATEHRADRGDITPTAAGGRGSLGRGSRGTPVVHRWLRNSVARAICWARRATGVSGAVSRTMPPTDLPVFVSPPRAAAERHGTWSRSTRSGRRRTEAAFSPDSLWPPHPLDEGKRAAARRASRRLPRRAGVISALTAIERRESSQPGQTGSGKPAARRAPRAPRLRRRDRPGLQLGGPGSCSWRTGRARAAAGEALLEVVATTSTTPAHSS